MVGDNIRQVEFWTERYRIIGKIYTPVGAGHSWRFSDILNKADRSFIPVCDVTVFSLETKDVVWRGDFLALNKVSIILATSED
jgi:hypothetical protein